MTSAILLVLAGLVGLGIGGEWLVRGAVGIAQRMGISNLVTGLVIVGAATSMPEMVASIQAALIGSPEIAWGNIAGSNLANTLLILGAAALVAPIILTGTGRRDAVVALAASVVIWFLAWRGWAFPLLGVGLLVLLIVYIVWRYRHPRPADEEVAGEPPILWKALLFFVIGVVALILGGKLLVEGAVDIARFAGLSETVIGLTVVAIGTSLPELAASIAAALRGKSGLALGNVVGSNIYNLLLIGGVTMTISPVAYSVRTGRLRVACGSGQCPYGAAAVLVRTPYRPRAGRSPGRRFRREHDSAVRIKPRGRVFRATPHHIESGKDIGLNMLWRALFVPSRLTAR